MRKIGQLLIIVIIIVMMLPGITAWANDNLHIYFVDVGQADAAIIACDDNVLMIDGGNVADSQLIFSVLRNTLGIEHINYMIATHPHEDHVGGLAAALNACSVDVLLTPVMEYDTKAFRSMMDAGSVRLQRRELRHRRRLRQGHPCCRHPVPDGSPTGGGRHRRSHDPRSFEI